MLLQSLCESHASPSWARCHRARARQEQACGGRWPFLTAAARGGVDWPQAGAEERRFSRTEELDGSMWRGGVSMQACHTRSAWALAVALECETLSCRRRQPSDRNPNGETRGFRPSGARSRSACRAIGCDPGHLLPGRPRFGELIPANVCSLRYSRSVMLARSLSGRDPNSPYCQRVTAVVPCASRRRRHDQGFPLVLLLPNKGTLPLAFGVPPECHATAQLASPWHLLREENVGQE